METLSGQPIDDQKYETIQAIANWLASQEQDYLTGLELLVPHCRNRMLLMTLQKKDSTYNRQKLAYELGKLIDNPEMIQATTIRPKVVLLTQPQTDNQQTETIEEAPTEALDETPSEPSEQALQELGSQLDAIAVQQKELYQRKTELSNQLVASGDSNEPAAVADRVLIVEQLENTEAEYNQLAEQKERLLIGANEPVQATAVEPGQEPIREQSEQKAKLDSLKLQRKALAPNVSKARKAFEAKPEDVPKQEKLARLEAELKELDDQIKLLSEPAS